ncbi:hypothetical protein [Luteolibacter soli]|uniref:Toxin co-regulated pilus biosynthesis protein Q C-terminal domain-containing protein n=1 Tax=Luteolibacter soli TaxID=3135280 RepID=A0ABU9ARD6_9BACT
MKISTTCLPFLAIALAVPATSLAVEPVVMRDAATHDQLVEKLKVATNQNPLVKFTPAEGPDPSVAAQQSGDLMETSDFLSFGGRATLVPKHAILNIPPLLANRIKLERGSAVQTWAEFYASNRGWITTVEVSRVQAEGNQALGEELSKRMEKSSTVVVATYQGGPISVLPLKVPVKAAPAETAGAQKPATIKKP